MANVLATSADTVCSAAVFRYIHTYIYIYVYIYMCPRVEWRGLKIGGGNLVHRNVIFCIFKCQSI